MTITLWGRLNSINVQKAAWTLEEIGLAYGHIPLGGSFGGLDDAGYRALNPNARVPTLRDGDLVVWESHAIVRYLAAEYDAGGLWPTDPRERAMADQWTDWTATRFQSAWLAVFESIVRVPEAKRDQGRIEAARAEANRLYSRLDAALADKPYLAGQRLTYADIVVGVSMHRWMTMPNERLPMPNLEAWYARVKARPGFEKVVEVSYADMFGVPVPVAPP